MTDKDKEAFEAWVKTTNHAVINRTGRGYANLYMAAQYAGWQAARDYYAPKLSDADIRRLSDYIWRKIQPGENGISREMIGHEIKSIFEDAGILKGDGHDRA